MQNLITCAADLQDIYAIVLNAAQQSNAATAKQVIAALLQFSDTSDVYALHTTLSKINAEGDAMHNALCSVSDYVSII